MDNKSLDQATNPCDIAIVGLSSIFPGSQNKDEFWSDILSGKNRITQIPESHWNITDHYDADPHAKDKTYCRKGGFIPSVKFNPLKFGLPPSSLTATDSSQILGLVAAREVLDDFCEQKPLTVKRERISVILGTTCATELITDMASRLEAPKWRKALSSQNRLSPSQIEEVCHQVSSSYPEWQESTFPGLLSNVVAGRIAHRLDLRGTNLVTDAACASSLAAIKLSINELLLNQTDLVITGGVDTFNTIFMYMCFSKTPALSATEECRPFSEDADGTLIGEGIGLLALKRLKDAEQAGDAIYAVIKGVGSSSDGLGKSIYAPDSKGQAKALNMAYSNASYSPLSVELIEAHGTGTKAGDTCEVESLRAVFDTKNAKSWCALGSVKSQIGHTKAAAGAAGLIKAVCALQHKVLPPTLGASRAHHKIREDNSPFYLNTQSRPWIRDASHPRRAGVSSFGFGGSNFHITLEEYIPKEKTRTKKKVRQFSSEAFFFAADTHSTLVTKILQMQSDSETKTAFHYLAEKNHNCFSSAKHRLAFVATSKIDLQDKLKLALQHLQTDTKNTFSKDNIYYSSVHEPGKIAFLFPGQGSQYLQMGAHLCMNFDKMREVWDQIAGLNLTDTQQKLHEFVFPPHSFSVEEETAQKLKLQETQWAQAAIASSSAAMLNLLRSFKIEADFYAGHSLGGLTALYASGAMPLTELVQSARNRGLFMQEAAGDTACGMLAIASSAMECQKFLTASQSQAVIANINSPGQTILSGELVELEKVQSLLKKQNIVCKMLPVMTAFHSARLKGAQKKFQNFLSEIPFASPQQPVFCGMTANAYPAENTHIKKLLAEEICSPVLFMDTVLNLYTAGVRTFIEVGPNNVLTKLVRSILQGHTFTALSVDSNGADPVLHFWQTLAQLAVAGVSIDLRQISTEYSAEMLVNEDENSFTIAINGANLKSLSSSPRQPLDRTRKEIQEDPTATKERMRPKDMDSQKFISTPNNGQFNPELERLKFAQQLQQETFNIHREFQKTMTDTHLAFLKSSDHYLSMLLEPRKTLDLYGSSIAATPTQNISPVLAKSERLLPTKTEAFSPSLIQDLELGELKEFGTQLNPQKITAQHEKAESNTPSFEADNEPLRTVLLSVIAEKTGYPQDMIKMDMSLDLDLGIDSIKRVEIFSHLAEQVPQLANIDSQETAKLASLEDILNFMSQLSPDANSSRKKKSPSQLASKITLNEASSNSSTLQL